MASCRSCSRDLDPSWKFCVHCGTAVRSADAAAPASVAPPASASLAFAAPAPPAPAPAGPSEPAPVTVVTSTATAVAAPALPSPGTPVSPDAAVWTSAAPSTWPGAPLRPGSSDAVPAAIRPDDAQAAPREFSVLAIVGFALSVIGFAPAFALGHLALARVRAHGLRGAGFAIAAIVLGYVFLAVWIVAGVLAAVMFLRL